MAQKKKAEASSRHHFYGTTIVGERGQAVIPAEARKALGFKKGEKLLVFGIGTGSVSFTKLASIERFEAHLSKRLEAVRKVIKKNK